MTTLTHIELTCPICLNRFSSPAVLSTNSFGGKRTDFHDRAAGAQPPPYFVHLCSCCGYAGAERDFGEEVEVSPTLKERLRYERVEGEVTAHRKQQWVIHAAIRQRDCPREWFG